MKKRSGRDRRVLLYVVALVVIVLGLMFLGLMGEGNNLSFFQPPAPPCATPGVIPATIPASVSLCGTISVVAPSVITASNVVVTCSPGTVIRYTGVASNVDGIKINSGLNSVSINGCSFNGKFQNAIHLLGGVTNSQISGNNFNNVRVGIREDLGSQNNMFLRNTFSNLKTGLHLEGSSGIVRTSNIQRAQTGILLGTPLSQISSSTPGAICSSGTLNGQSNFPVICSLPQNGRGYSLYGNTITYSDYGIDNNALDTIIGFNTIQSNQEGIRLNAIYIGSEVNPNVNPPWGNQEYFNSGATVSNNVISNNKVVGIRGNGRSEFFWQTTQGFQKGTIISSNTISNNGNQNDFLSGGIVLGREDYLNPNEKFYAWDEYTKIDNNQINGNSEGIILQRGNWMTDVVYNTISNSFRNGIKVGTSKFSFSYPDFSSFRFIYHNSILNNGVGAGQQTNKNGIKIENGYTSYVVLNEINYNGNDGVYVPSDPSVSYSQHVINVICNDISYNSGNGFNYDGYNFGNPNYIGISSIHELSYNRLINNANHGLRYYLGALGPFQNDWMRKTFNNYIKSNGGYGAYIDGFSYHGFFANNFMSNQQGRVFDTGSLGIENEWDERQYELAYDNVVCKNCGGACNNDWDCGLYQGTCVNNICQPPPGSGLSCNPATGNVDCYANPNSLPYVYQYYYTYPNPYNPVGNFGLNPTFIVNPSFAPPLNPTSCSNHRQCTTNSCEYYPVPINNNQCGNGDFIGSQSPFVPYYQPLFSCPYGYYWPPYPSVFTIPPVPPVDPPPPEEPNVEKDLQYDFYREFFGTDNPSILEDRMWIEFRNRQ